jgi:hypothetical protein
MASPWASMEIAKLPMRLLTAAPAEPSFDPLFIAIHRHLLHIVSAVMHGNEE